jgi:hypothetical protein
MPLARFADQQINYGDTLEEMMPVVEIIVAAGLQHGKEHMTKGYTGSWA